MKSEITTSLKADPVTIKWDESFTLLVLSDKHGNKILLGPSEIPELTNFLNQLDLGGEGVAVFSRFA